MKSKFILLVTAFTVILLITTSCKKETTTVTPTSVKSTYAAADLVGSYTVKKSEWTANPLGIGSVGETWTWKLVSKDSVTDGYLTYHVDSTGFISAPPRPNLYVVSAFGSYDLKTISLTMYVTRDNYASSGTVIMTKP